MHRPYGRGGFMVVVIRGIGRCAGLSERATHPAFLRNDDRTPGGIGPAAARWSSDASSPLRLRHDDRTPAGFGPAAARWASDTTPLPRRHDDRTATRPAPTAERRQTHA